MSEWQHYMLMQISNDMRELKLDMRELKPEVRSLRSQIEELTTWAQRLCLLVLLWAAGIAINLDPEAKGQFFASVLKSIK